MIDKLGEAGLVTVGKVVDAWRSGNADSYADYTRPSRVEPLMIVDSTMMFDENTTVVSQTLLSAFSAYYLLAWNMLQVSIDNVAINRHLDKLNPNRSVKDSMVDSAGAIWMLSKESYAYRLPHKPMALRKPSMMTVNLESAGSRNIVTTSAAQKVIDQRMEELRTQETASLIAANDADAARQALKDEQKKLGKTKEQIEQMGKDANAAIQDTISSGIKDASDAAAKRQKSEDAKRDVMQPGGLVARSTEVIKEASNLAVGKLLEVQISNGNNKATLPVWIRINASVMVPDLMAQLLATGNADTSLGTRWIKYESGQINLLDLMTARDLVKQHKKNLFTDKSGLYAAIAGQQRNNKLSGLLSLNPSVANASNLAIVAEDTIKKVEMEIGGRFSDFKTRQKLFDATGLFIVAVVDRRYDRVTFYTNGIAHSSNVAIKDCQAANSKKDASVTDILKAYQLGNSPSF